MKFRSLTLLGVTLQLLCCNLAQAQAGNSTSPVLGGLGLPLPGASAPMTARKPPGEARTFGADGQTLPGQRVTAASDIQRKWIYRETRKNVVLDGVRVPLRTTNLTLELRPDGSYTLNYEVYWGAERNDPEAQQAGLVVKEQGRYALSGSILLLEAEPLEAIEQGRFESKRRSVAAGKRAYIARLQGEQLNIAGPCAVYQIETVCGRSRSVWLPLTLRSAMPGFTIGSGR
jgi:hypothetical protein